MTPALRIAPDGARALAALLKRGAPAPLTPAMAAALAPEHSADPVAALAAVYARRRQHAASIAVDGRAPAARFLRRLHRRWRVTQSADPQASVSIAALERAGRRALRRGLGWPQASPLAVGAWHAFWAVQDARQRRDLLALLPRADARRVAQIPLSLRDAQRCWR